MRQVVRNDRMGPDDYSTSLRSMQERFLPPHTAAAILLNQRIKEQTTIDTAMDDRVGRQFRLSLLDHQAFAFLTSHGAHLLLM
jgi:hypothetical protein